MDNVKHIGRPRIYNADTIADNLLAYIDSTDQPFIQEYCLNDDISKDTLYRLAKDNTALSDAIKKALSKQELYMLKNAGSTVNPVFAIFRLKQPCFGYTDKADIQITGIQAQPDPEQLEASIQNILDKLPDSERQKLLGSG